MTVSREQILQKEHDLLSDICLSVWDELNEKEKTEVLFYIAGCVDLADDLLKLMNIGKDCK